MPNRFEHPGGEAGDLASASGPASTPARAELGAGSQAPAATGTGVGNLRGARSGWSAWRCASLASLALAGCVVANVAGCGGGGGGSVVLPTPQLATATILLLTAQGRGINGTVTLNGVTKTTTNNRAVFTNLRPGSYALVFTAAGVTTRTNIAVSSQLAQTFVVVPGQSNVSSNGIRISGRTVLNTPADSLTASCNANSQPVTAAVVLQVRALNLIARPIVASVVRPANADGRFVIFSIPSAGTYRVEARSLDATAAPFAGTSASFTVNAGQTQANLDICTNQSLTAPGGTPPPPPGTPTAGPGTGTPSGSGTPSGTSTPNATLTANPNATLTPIVIGTATPTGTQPASAPTSTPNPNATPTPTVNGTPVATNTPGGVPTSTPAPLPTATPSPTPLPTAGPGTPTATPSPTPTAIGQATPPGSPRLGRRRR